MVHAGRTGFRSSSGPCAPKACMSAQILPKLAACPRNVARSRPS
jgi:hypothetical protein